MPDPDPDVDPEPEPRPTEPPPFVLDDTEPDGGLPGVPERARLQVRKSVIGRDVVRPGGRVRFRLWAYNLGFASARGVRVCDSVPRGLALIHAPGSPEMRGARLCWRLGVLDTQRRAVVTFRVRGDGCGAFTNGLTGTSANGGRTRSTARVFAPCRVAPAVTG
ncbi:MAG: hypothetical protein AB7V62_04785 [Thermoleophilia bacterium]